MYKPTYKKRTARMISWVCGSLFTLFSLLYLFVMQADLLAKLADNCTFHPV